MADSELNQMGIVYYKEVQNMHIHTLDYHHKWSFNPFIGVDKLENPLADVHMYMAKTEFQRAVDSSLSPLCTEAPQKEEPLQACSFVAICWLWELLV